MSSRNDKEKAGFWLELGHALRKSPGRVVGTLVFFIVLCLTLPLILPVIKSWISELVLVLSFSITIVILAASIYMTLREDMKIKKENVLSARLHQSELQDVEIQEKIRREIRKVTEMMRKPRNE